MARPLAVEGFFQSVAQGLGETYLSALMVWLGAGGVVLGLVGTIPTAASAFSQIVAARLVAGARGARNFIANTWVLQGVALALLGCLAQFSSSVAIPLLLAGAIAAWFLAGVSVPAWTGLVSIIVPRAQHGSFFGLRGTLQQTGVVVAILGGGVVLSVAVASGSTSLGYLLVFGAAGLLRVIGAGFLAGVPEVERSRPTLPARAVFDALKASAKFRRLAIYLWAFHFATWVAAPFFLPYMLRDLGLDYATAAVLVAVPAVVKALAMRGWGSLADRVGPGPLLRRMGWYVLPVSAMWLVSGSPWWILVAQMYAGLVWGGFELAQASALLQTTRGREQAVALFNAVDGAVMILGSVVGGLIVAIGERMIGTGFLTAIAASSVLRILATTVLLGRVRKIGIPAFSHRRIPMRFWGVRATRGASFRPWGELPPETKSSEKEDPTGRPR